MKVVKSIIFVLFVLFSVSVYSQSLSVNELFNNGVVLQQKSKTLIWGNAIPGNMVTVTVQGKNFSTKVNENGDWTNQLLELQPGGPFQMTIKSGNDSLSISEVYVGDVWIAGGQSNMGFMLENDEKGKEEIGNASNKNIHFVMVPVITYRGQKTKGNMDWKSATTENVSSMSAVAYYFAKELQPEINVPIGIICCYKGGTAAEVWVSRETLLKNSEFAPIIQSYDNYMKSVGEEKYNALYEQYQKDFKAYGDSVKAGFKDAVHPIEPMGDKHYKRPYVLYENMFKRIIPFTSRGVIWYQGEANASRAEQYRSLFPALISEWRSDLQNKNLPFLFVQLANYDHPSYKDRPFWTELREAQLLTWKKVKNTGMAVTIDVGEKNTIHPPHKVPVGKRLAAIALNQVYRMNVPYSGPVFKQVTFHGNKAILSFDFIYSGLTSNGQLKGFTICGKDKKFVPAKAEIVNHTIVVYADNVSKPIALRY